MNSIEIWTDPAHNRLHLVLKHALTEEEAESAALLALAAAKQLKPGFAICVSHDLSDDHTPRFCPLCKEGPHISAAARRRHVNRILRAIDSQLVA